MADGTQVACSKCAIYLSAALEVLNNSLKSHFLAKRCTISCFSALNRVYRVAKKAFTPRRRTCACLNPILKTLSQSWLQESKAGSQKSAVPFAKRPSDPHRGPGGSSTLADPVDNCSLAKSASSRVTLDLVDFWKPLPCSASQAGSDQRYSRNTHLRYGHSKCCRVTGCSSYTECTAALF